MSISDHNPIFLQPHDFTLDKVKNIFIDLGRSQPEALELLSSISAHDLSDMVNIAHRACK